VRRKFLSHQNAFLLLGFLVVGDMPFSFTFEAFSFVHAGSSGSSHRGGLVPYLSGDTSGSPTHIPVAGGGVADKGSTAEPGTSGAGTRFAPYTTTPAHHLRATGVYQKLSNDLLGNSKQMSPGHSLLARVSWHSCEKVASLSYDINLFFLLTTSEDLLLILLVSTHDNSLSLYIYITLQLATK
jgi:hypothetical protein